MKKFKQVNSTLYGLDLGLQYNVDNFQRETLNKTVRGGDGYTKLHYKEKLSQEGIKSIAAVHLKTALQVLGLNSLDNVAFGLGDFISAKQIGVYPVYVCESQCDDGMWEYQVESWISEFTEGDPLSNELFMESSLLVEEDTVKLYKETKTDKWGTTSTGWELSL